MKNIIEELLDSLSPEESLRIEKRMLLAAKLDDAMQAKGWRKKDLMLAMGKKNQSEITRWLSGTHNFTSDLLIDLGRVLNVDFLNLEKPLSPKVIYKVSLNVAIIPEYNYSTEFAKSTPYLRSNASA